MVGVAGYALVEVAMNARDFSSDGAHFELEQVQIEEALPALEEKLRSVTCLVDLAATTAAPSGGDKSGTCPVP